MDYDIGDVSDEDREWWDLYGEPLDPDLYELARCPECGELFKANFISGKHGHGCYEHDDFDELVDGDEEDFPC